jgi:hypothetical protein
MKKYYILSATLLILSSFAFSSEFILRVKKQEQVIVSVQSQTQTNTSNYFQFYQLPGGQTHIKVLDKWTGQTLFSNYVVIPTAYQVYAELDYSGTMNILSSTPMATYNNQVGSVNYGNSGNNSPWNYGNSGNTGNWGSWGNTSCNNTTNSNSYNQFLAALRNESFDSYRLKDAKRYVSKTMLSAQQISEIASTFSFDSYRLDFAKAAYNSCYDKTNYFLLKNTFTFTSYYNDLIDSIN